MTHPQVESNRILRRVKSAGVWSMLLSAPLTLVGAAYAAYAGDRAPPVEVSRSSTADVTADAEVDSPKAWSNRLRRDRSRKDVGRDPFSSRSWVSPPKPAKQPAPTVPRFPFTFVGLLSQKNSPIQLFLSRGERLYTVASGDLLDKAYRVDRVTKTLMELTYLPLGKKQSIDYADITHKPDTRYSGTSNNPTASRREPATAETRLSSSIGTRIEAPSASNFNSVTPVRSGQAPQSFSVGAAPVSQSSAEHEAAANGTGSSQARGGSMQMLAPATRLQTQPPLTQLLTQPPLTHLDTQPPPSGTLPTLLPPGSGMPIAPAPAGK